MASQASKAALTRFMTKFTKDYGEGSIMTAEALAGYQVISTGSVNLDYRTGVGGLVEGRLVEYWGPDGVGKTTLALMACREAQKKYSDREAAWIDVEHKLDKEWARKQGVDTTRLYVYPPSNAEDVADAMKDFIRSGLFSVIVLDSIGAMIPEAEKEKDADKAVMAQQAKIITRMVKIAASECKKTGAIPLMLNQVRANLSYGADTTTGGGFALKHSTTMKMRIRRTGTNPFKTKISGESEQVIVGHEIAVYMERNGVAPAYRTAIMSLFNQPTARYGPVGIDRVDEVVTLGLDLGLIIQDGGWYTVTTTGERLNGQDKLKAGLRGQPEVVEELRAQILATVASEVFEEEIPPEQLAELTEPEPEKTNGAKKTTAKKAPAKKAAKATKATKKATAKPKFRRGTAAAQGSVK